MPFSLKTMKSVDLLCASPASTVIAPTRTEPPETPRRSLSSRALQRLNTLFAHRESSSGNGHIPTPTMLEPGPGMADSTCTQYHGSRKSSAEKSPFELPFTPRAAAAALFGKDKSRKSSAEKSMFDQPFTPRASFFSREKSRRRRSSADEGSTSTIELPSTPRASSFFSRERSRKSSAEKRLFELPFTPRAAFFGRENSRKSSAEKSMFELPFTPRAAFFGREKSRKSSAEHSGKSHNSVMAMMTTRRKSSVDVYGLYTHTPSSSKHLLSDMQDPNPSMWPQVPPNGRTPPARSGDKTTIRRDDCLKTTSKSSDSRHRRSSIALNPDQLKAAPKVTGSSSAAGLSNTKGSTGSPPAADQSRNQIVVLRVSIHCKGCEAKLRKHISRMEGVTSFSIDLATKKVTINGNVTPVEVLTSISKVKYAQFWPSLPPSAPSTIPPSAASSTSTVGFFN